MDAIIPGEENLLGEHSYKYLTVDEMKSLGDDSMPIDVTHDEKQQAAAAGSVSAAGTMVSCNGRFRVRFLAA